MPVLSDEAHKWSNADSTRDKKKRSLAWIGHEVAEWLRQFDRVICFGDVAQPARNFASLFLLDENLQNFAVWARCERILTNELAWADGDANNSVLTSSKHIVLGFCETDSDSILGDKLFLGDGKCSPRVRVDDHILIVYLLNWEE